MATSSITANFYTDDPKVATKFARALSSTGKPSAKLPTAAGLAKHYTPAQERAFWARFKKAHGIAERA